jgi:outer membrane protein assembly factor BamB
MHIDQGGRSPLPYTAGLIILIALFTTVFIPCINAEPAGGNQQISQGFAWKFHSDLANSGIYDDGGSRPEGGLLWKFTTSGDVRSSPSLADDIVYFGSNDHNLYALNASTGVLLWNFTALNGIQTCPAVTNGVVYAGSWDNNIYALDGSTGALLWNYTTAGSVISSPGVADGVVYVGSWDKNLYALDASTGALLWNYTTGAEIDSSPAVVNGVVYIGSNDHNLYAINASTGALLWNYTTGAEVESSPSVAGDTVYVGSNDHNLYAINASTGALLWNYTTGAEVESSPAVANGVVYFGRYDNNLYAVNASTGEPIWTYPMGTVFSSPAVANGVVYAGDLDGTFNALDATSGALLWRYNTPDTMIFSSPAVANGIVYIGNDDGSLYAFGSFPDEPPASVTALHTVSTGQLRITWVWTDPRTIGFSHVMVYLNGIFQGNVSKGTGTWNVSGLSPATAYTISTRTVGEKGWINQTWVNNTATTGGLSVSYIDPREVMEGSPAFTLEVYGTGFSPNSSIIQWNGAGQATRYLQSGQLEMVVPAELVAHSRRVAITVFDNLSGEVSNTAYLLVTDGPNSAKAWKFRSDLPNSGVYENGGIRPDGDLLWNYTTQGRVGSSPAVANGIVYVGSQDNNLYAFNASTGANLWTYNSSEPGSWVSSSPAVADGVVYIGGLRTKVQALDALTGTLLWNYTVPGGFTSRIEVSSSPAVKNGVVYICSYDGNIYAFDAINGTLFWKYNAYSEWGGPFSSPSVANGTVYFGSRDNNLNALDAETGTPIWHYTTGGWVDSSPAVANGVVYFGSQDHNLYAIDEATGALKWDYTTGGVVSSSPAVADGTVYFGSMDNNVYALDAATGLARWQFTTASNVTSSPAVADGVVYVGSYDKNLYAIDAATGALLWNFTTGDGIKSSPAVADGTVYIGSRDGNLYAVGSSPVPVAPVANFMANETSGFTPLTVQFSDFSTGTKPLEYQWNFGDGTPNETVQDPVHTYTEDGTYNVTLTVSNSAGNSTLAKQGYVSARTIITGGGKAWYLVHSNVEGAEVYFNGDSFKGVIQNGTLLVQTCPTCTPVFSFTVKKCSFFTLTQPNDKHPGNNETVDLYAYLTAPKEPLIADFSGNVTSGQAPLLVEFTSHSIGIVQAWNWSFGDGTYSEEEQPAHIYAADGVYTVGLSESNSACQNDTIVKKDYIAVGTSKPTFQANFTVSPDSGMAPLTVKCIDTSIGKPTWFSYNFGDGITMSGPNPVHTYRFPGTYSITQTVSKYNSTTFTIMSSSVTKPDVITAGKVPFVMPVAQFNASPIQGSVPLTVAFTDRSTGNPTFFNYDFGDGINMTGPNPVHTYRRPGIYNVTLTVMKNDAANGVFVANSSVLSGLIVVNST